MEVALYVIIARWLPVVIIVAIALAGVFLLRVGWQSRCSDVPSRHVVVTNLS